jgi:carbon monoxide dehydrogenase subunit G
LRVGGTFTLENAGRSPPFTGVYTALERSRTIAFDAMGSSGTVSLTEDGGATRMQVTIRCGSVAQLEQLLEMGVDTNTEKTLDNLVKHVEMRRKSSR